MIDRSHAASWNLSHLSFLSFWLLRRVALYEITDFVLRFSVLNLCGTGAWCGTTLHNSCEMVVVLGSYIKALWFFLMQPLPYYTLHAKVKRMHYIVRLNVSSLQRERES